MSSQPAPSPSRDFSGLVSEVFAEWRRQGIKFVILRNHEGLPHDVGHDVDLIVLPEQLAAAEAALVQSARRQGFLQHQRVEFLPVSLFFFHPESLRQIQFDLFHDLRWRGFSYATARELLEHAQDRGLFWIPHPAQEAVNSLLTRQIYHGYVKAEYKVIIQAGFQQHPEETRAWLEKMFGATIANQIVAGVAAGDWKNVEAQTGAMRRQLIWRGVSRHPARTLRALVRDAFRLTQRLVCPPGLTVVLLGPDGSGKSTVARELLSALNDTFKTDKSRLIHWKPVVFFRRRRLADATATTNPHGGTSRGWFGSTAALGFHWLEYLLGRFRFELPVRFRNGWVLYDRYHYDFLVDPRRYRLNLPGRWPLRLFRLLPAPELVFLLDVPVQKLLERKHEVSLAEVQRQRAAFRDVANRLPQAKIIAGDQPLNLVVAEITRNILEQLHRRASGPRSQRVESVEDPG